jgi:hypothetical protein
MAKCVLRYSWAVHDVRGSSVGALIPMWKQLTGEPVAGKPHTGFGGEGTASVVSYPYPLAGLRPCCWGSATCRTRPAFAGDINFASGNPFLLNRHRHGRIESAHPVLARQTATLRLHNAEFNSSR